LSLSRYEAGAQCHLRPFKFRHQAGMRVIAICFLFAVCNPLAAQHNTISTNGIQIITSGGEAADSVFIALIADSNASVIFIPTAASSLRLPNNNSGVIWNPDETLNESDFKQELLKRFKLNDITILHTRNHQQANTESFVTPLRKAKAVWISGGNPGRFMSVYQGTLLEKELKMFLKRGGIIGGESAGAIVQGSYTMRQSGKACFDGCGQRDRTRTYSKRCYQSAPFCSETRK
jgi:cyanophycinase-like exopeptidase